MRVIGMARTQIQLTPQQAEAITREAADEAGADDGGTGAGQ